MSEFIVVIPARYASERLPGKPLRRIAGKVMLQHVYERGQESNAREVFIATDNQKIFDVAESFGASVCMTDDHHYSGTERIAQVSEQMNWADSQVIINLQGDEPLMPASLINQCVELLDNSSADIATLASPFASRADYQNHNVVKVIIDIDSNALYFSRSSIPYSRREKTNKLAVQTAMHHHGIYAYRCATLRKFVAAERSTLEICEQLEQLRALSIGLKIKVARALSRPPPSVDTEQDLVQIESLFLDR